MKNLYKPEEKLAKAFSAIEAGDKERALGLLKELLKDFPENVPALGMAGTLETELGRFDVAHRYLERALELEPDNLSILYNLARLNQLQGDRQGAMALYRRILEGHPGFGQALNNMGLLLKEEGHLDKALEFLLRAADQLSGDPSVFNNLAVVQEALGHLDDARASLERALEIKPDYLAARFNLGCLLHRLGEFEEARRNLEWVLSEQPNEPTALFLLQSMGFKHGPDRAPVQYVSRTFDHWAAQFEDKLLDELDYQTPRQLFNVLRPFLGKDEIILDLGCGTGLGAEYYRPYAKRLVGLDCSAGMLEIARQKAIYDQLIQQDILEPWPFDTPFSCIYSSDCLCYFGELGSVFKRIRQNLKAGGILGFSVEALEDVLEEERVKGYLLQPSGRYAHSTKYITTALRSAGFIPTRCERTILRRDEGQPVRGYLFVASTKE